MVSSIYRRSGVGMTICHQRDFEAQYKLLLHRAEIVKVFGESCGVHQDYFSASL